MPDNPTEDRRIDLSAPLLSVRRFHSVVSARGGGAERARRKGEGDGRRPQSQGLGVDDRVATAERSPLPFYKPDLKSGPVRDPGVVPFVWEQSPGRPKEGTGDKVVDRPSVPPALPPGRRSGGDRGAVASTTGKRLQNGEDMVTAMEKKPTEQLVRVEDPHGNGGDEDDDDEEAFSDALETLSRAESDFMNCSVSGMTAVGETATDAGNPASCFSTDPQVRDFMMGRFLPAAQAIATETGPPDRTRKAAAPPPPSPMVDGVRRRPLPLPYQNQPRSGLWYTSPKPADVLERDEDEYEDEDEDDCYGTRGLAMRGCGFLLPKFCLKSSFGTMKSYRPSSQKHYIPEQTWKAVYRQKLGDRRQEMRVDNVTKTATESCPLAFRSNSHSPDGSSPYRRSTVGDISPCKNAPSRSPFCETKAFLGFPSDAETENVESESSRNGNDVYWELKPHLSSKSGSGPGSPVVEKTLYIDSVQKLEAYRSRSSSIDSKVLLPVDKDSEFGLQSARKEVHLVLESREASKFQDDIPEVIETDITSLENRTVVGEERDFRGKTKEVSVDTSGTKKLEDRIKEENNISQPLPPLKSPSESWLCRTLPAVSSKSLTSQTFLGMQFNTKKKTIQKSAADAVKTCEVHIDQKRFSEVLEMPVDED